ncbi:MAG TPA: extracellular solute-binding protein [Chloroflexota bacterium]|nr:extracellular solute-binding protein [Chloroflexota bacterium]
MSIGEHTMITRRACVAAAAMAAGALGTACAGAGGSGGKGDAAAPAGGLRSGVTVSFFHGGQQAEADARIELLKAFNAKYPQIKTEQLYTPQETGPKLDSLLSAGTPPDIFYIANGADVTTRASRGSLHELGPLARRDKFETSDFFESALGLYQLCGKQYAYPLDFPNQQLYYNIDLFEQAGVKAPPTTWSDTTWTFDRFLDSARRVTKETGGGTQWGYLTAHTAFRNWWVWVAANGGELLDKDNKTCLLNEPASVEAFQFLQDLVFKNRVMPDPKQYTDAGTNLNGFFTGRGAMSTLPPWLGQVRRDMKQRWDVAPHPRGSNAKARWACAGGGTGLALASTQTGGKNINEAWELLKFASQKPQVEVFTRINGIVPPLKSVANSAVFADPNQPPNGVKIFTDGAQFLRSDPSIVRWGDITRAITEELGALWSNTANARTVADGIKRKVDGILAEIHSSGEMACK